MTSPGLFTSLAAVLLTGESLTFTVLRQGDTFAVLLQPKLQKKGETPADAQRIRAALAMPLNLIGTPADLDTAFHERVSGYAEARAELAGNYETMLSSLSEASKEAKSKSTGASKAPTKPAKTPSPPTDSHENDVPAKPAASVDSSHNLSLI